MAGLELRNILSANLKKLRGHRQWSQMDLAEKAFLSTNFVSDIERGLKWPYPETLQNLAAAFGVAVYELFKPDDEEDPGIEDFINRFSNDVFIAVEKSVQKTLKSIKNQYGR
jgi:transcriptional regulator with XRE-family HTH domain